MWERATRYYHGLTIVYDDHPSSPFYYTDHVTGGLVRWNPEEPSSFVADPEGVVANMLSDLGFLSDPPSFIQRGRAASWWVKP